MSVSYPSAPKSFTTKADGPGNTIAAAHINDLQDEVVAMETALITDGVAHDLKPSTAGGHHLGSSALPWGTVHARAIDLDASSELTIASGAVTVSRSYHSIDTESDAATDDLDTLTASGVTAGFIVIFKAENAARAVTFKDGSGNLLLNGDYTLNATDRTITLIYDGTNWKEIARSVQSLVLDRSTTEQEIVSSGTATSVYSFSVPGTASTNRILRLTVEGSYLNNSGSPDNLWVRVRFGTVTIAGDVSAGGTLAGPAASANRRSFKLVADITANGATNSQRSTSIITLGAASATETDWAAVSAHAQVMKNGLTVDTTAAAVVDVFVQLGTSSANISFKRTLAMLEAL